MREEQVFLSSRKCVESSRSRNSGILKDDVKDVMMKEHSNPKSDADQVSLSKRIEMVQISQKTAKDSSITLTGSSQDEQDETVQKAAKTVQNTSTHNGHDADCTNDSANEQNGSEQRVMSLPQVTITCPLTMDKSYDAPDNTEGVSKECKTEYLSDTAPKTGKLAGRRALPEITITCPPVDAFDIQENDDSCNGLFTQRKYMICRESPRSGRRTVSLVDFPNGLASLEKADSFYLESPINFLDSPYSFSNVDLSFTYPSPLNSPLTPPFTPEMKRSSKYQYPGAVPVFRLEDSFPPAKFGDETST